MYQLRTYQDKDYTCWIGIFRDGNVTSYTEGQVTLTNSIFDFRSWTLDFNGLQLSFPVLPNDTRCYFNSSNNSFVIYGALIKKVNNDDEKNNIIFLEKDDWGVVEGYLSKEKDIVNVSVGSRRIPPI